MRPCGIGWAVRKTSIPGCSEWTFSGVWDAVFSIWDIVYLPNTKYYLVFPRNFFVNFSELKSSFCQFFRFFGCMMDNFFRLGLERSHSAEEAVTVITSLLESHGQVSGPSSFCTFNLWISGNFHLPVATISTVEENKFFLRVGTGHCPVGSAPILLKSCSNIAQGGQCSNIVPDFSYHNSFLIADCNEVKFVFNFPKSSF